MKRVCVFAGSSLGTDPVYKEEVRKLGEALGKKGIELVYGGAKSGLMGVMADEVLANGGRVTGVMPTRLFTKEIAHPDVTEMIEVDTMHERKAKMSELADGYIALPGDSVRGRSYSRLSAGLRSAFTRSRSPFLISTGITHRL